MLSHLQQLMEDSDVYGWKVTRDFHATWVQKMEQGRAAWGETGKKEKFKRLLVWSSPPTHKLHVTFTHQTLSSHTSSDPRSYGEEMDISANLPTQGTESLPRF